MIKHIKSEKYLKNDFGVIVPFSITGKIRADFEYEVYDTFAPLLQDEMESDISDYLTERFYRRMNLLLSGPAKALGYVPDASLTHSFILHYRAQTADPSLVLDSTVRVDDISAYTDLTDADFDTGEYPVFATVQNGRIVSVCGINGPIADGVLEIAVETIAAARGNGYARSNIAAMIREIERLGMSAAYLCYPDNTASIKLAAACGLTLYSRDYHFVCYEKER